jgi:hypothetical protein
MGIGGLNHKGILGGKKEVPILPLFSITARKAFYQAVNCFLSVPTVGYAETVIWRTGHGPG